MCFSSSGVRGLFSFPPAAARAEQWPASIAMLHGMFLSVALKYSSGIPYLPVVFLKPKIPPPNLSVLGLSLSKPIAEIPQFPVIKEVMPCLMKGLK